jgi:hypothetical protein
MAIQVTADVETHQAAPVSWCKPTNERETNEMTKKANEAHSFGQAMDAINESIGSGWASVWEALIGDFDEATTLWTAFQKTARNVY